MQVGSDLSGGLGRDDSRVGGTHFNSDIGASSWGREQLHFIDVGFATASDSPFFDDHRIPLSALCIDSDRRGRFGIWTARKFNSVKHHDV